jgi:hypothetical protein
MPLPKFPARALEELARHLSVGSSLLVATRDARMRPALARCGAARLGPDGLLRLAIPVPEGATVVANIEANGAIALTAALPITFRTLQVKGADAHRAPWPEQERWVDVHRRAFIEEAVRIGADRASVGEMWSTRFVSIAFTPAEVFDQTPGPSAGLALVP